jgi:hypothetical protein
MDEFLRVSNKLIHQIYFGWRPLRPRAAARLFFRNTRKTIVYDIVYAYTIIPFLLRALHIK